MGFLALCSVGLADELLVPSQYSTIQSAIDDANDGDTVIVAPGTYTGPGNRDIDFLGKAITVRSVFPDDPCFVVATVIDCNGSPNEPHRGFYFHSSEDENSILNGLTITNGQGLDDYHSDSSISTAGGGIYCYYSSPTIKNCIITENRAAAGGGICGENSSPIISNCRITKNGGTFQGGAVYGGGFFGFNTNVSFINCVIGGNIGEMGCAVFIDKGSPFIDGCIIRNNSTVTYGRGSLYFDRAVALEITNCLITGNNAEPGGICNWWGGGNATISNCTIVNNDPYAW